MMIKERYILRQVSEFIMSHSSKNGDISRLQSDYSRIFEKTTEEKVMIGGTYEDIY